jgi:hypothetical protein
LVISDSTGFVTQQSQIACITFKKSSSNPKRV